MTVNEKIGAVRGLMAKNGVDAIIIPGADPHMSEYFSHHWGTVTYISGFTGEAGTFVITKDIAGLWTDGRYYIQAAAEPERQRGRSLQGFRAGDPIHQRVSGRASPRGRSRWNQRPPVLRILRQRPPEGLGQEEYHHPHPRRLRQRRLGRPSTGRA